MRRPAAAVAAGVLGAALLAGGAPPAAAAEQAVTGAVLRWGVSAEAGNAGASPGTVNALAAGRVGDGDGNGRIDEPEWSASAGAVAVEQQRADGTSAPATFAGLRSTPDGTPLTDPGAGLTSGLVAVLTGGAGTVDPLTGAADVRWDGDLTVVLADGAGLVWVADPRLEVSADGSGRLLAQVQAAGRGVTTGAAEVTLAELDAVDVAAGTQQLTPAFLGVGWSGTPPQDTTGSSWGAFPASFLDLVGQAGLAVPWYSTGDPDDAAKPPLPVHLQLPAPEPPPSPLPSPPTSPPPDPGGVDVTDAQFRWGLNQEVGNAAFAPGTVNLLSAGRVPSTGPDQQIGADRWAATAGSVRIEKRQPDGSYALATFAGTRTTPAGQPLTTPSAGLWSDHQVVLDGGTGQVDVAAGEATVRWDGDFTVALYSGLTFFHVSDPVLTVAAGRGQVTATLGGYAADRADPTAWLPLPETPVVLADLGGVVLGAQGFTATPAYLGVGYDPPPGSSTAVQLREGATWGSFPRSFVDFQVAVGQGSYWYSSGGPTDRFKVALPLTVSFDASDPVPPPAAAPGVAAPAPPVTNPVVPPPARTPTASTGSPPRTAPRPPAAPPASPPLTTADALLDAPGTVRVGRDGTDLAGLLTPVPGPRDLGWWTAGGALLLTALLTWLVSSGRLTLGRRDRP